MVVTASAEIASKLGKAVMIARLFSFSSVIHDEVENSISLLFIAEWTLFGRALLSRFRRGFAAV